MPYNENLFEYVDAQGEPVPEEEIRASLDEYQQQQIARLPELDEDSTAEELAATVALIWALTRDNYIASAVIGAGTRANVPWSILGATMLNMYNDHYVGFSEEAPELSGSEILRRGRLYLTGGMRGYGIGYGGRFSNYQLELPTYPGVQTLCNINCKCHWDVREIDRNNGDWDAYWVRTVAESCPTCVGRALAWNPLEIRQGEWQNFVPINN